MSNQVTPGTGTLNVRGTFANADRMLSAGMYLRVRIPVGPPHSALLVSDRALGSDQGVPYLLVVDDKNQVVRRNVQVGGVHEGGLREITAGLPEHDWVIVDGLVRVRPGVTAAPNRQPMPVTAETAPTDATKKASNPSSATATTTSVPDSNVTKAK